MNPIIETSGAATDLDSAADSMKGGPKGRSMVSFRTSITVAVMTFVIALGALLTAIQYETLRLASREAASAYMDAASAKALGGLQAQVSEMTSLVNLLAASSTLADSSERTDSGRGIPLLRTALLEVPQMDSVYIGYDTGCWLEVRRMSAVQGERDRLRAPAGAAFVINLVAPTSDNRLPMRRIFEDAQENELEQLDLWDYGYDPRRRPWFRDTLAADRSLVSSPYIAFTIGVPVITVSSPLRGTVRGVVAADLKLDDFSAFVNSQRPGPHGTALLFDAAHPDMAQFVATAMTDPSHPPLPSVKQIGGLPARVLAGWDGTDRYEGSVRDEDGQDYLFRVWKFPLGEQSHSFLLLLASQGDFVQGVHRLQFLAVAVATLATAAFIPGVWLFGGRMSRSLRGITGEARRIQMLIAPENPPVASSIREVHELGVAMNLAQRAIASFARFVPKEIVKRIVDNSISTELGGTRQEITVVFTDVAGFTTIAEHADPDALMHRTSQYFTALTEAFLAEGGTVDKFIGDAVMVFWNAPSPQPDHVERACRAALKAKAASEQLNVRFGAEGTPPFVTRFGIHVGEAVVGNLGSAERMNYTALGSTVNMASRLEGMNKQYGTAILVSEDVCLRVAHLFRFRPMGSALAKGMTRETRIHELTEALA